MTDLDKQNMDMIERMAMWIWSITGIEKTWISLKEHITLTDILLAHYILSSILNQ